MNKITAAQEELSKVCKDPARFKMSIPVHKEDTDVVIEDALVLSQLLIHEVKKYVNGQGSLSDDDMMNVIDKIEANE